MWIQAFNHPVVKNLEKNSHLFGGFAANYPKRKIDFLGNGCFVKSGKVITSNYRQIWPLSWPMTFVVPSIVEALMSKIAFWISMCKWLEPKERPLLAMKQPCISMEVTDNNCSLQNYAYLGILHLPKLFAESHLVPHLPDCIFGFLHLGAFHYSSCLDFAPTWNNFRTNIAMGQSVAWCLCNIPGNTQWALIKIIGTTLEYIWTFCQSIFTNPLPLREVWKPPFIRIDFCLIASIMPSKQFYFWPEWRFNVKRGGSNESWKLWCTLL